MCGGDCPHHAAAGESGPGCADPLGWGAWCAADGEGGGPGGGGGRQKRPSGEMMAPGTGDSLTGSGWRVVALDVIGKNGVSLRGGAVEKKREVDNEAAIQGGVGDSTFTASLPVPQASDLYEAR